MAVVPNAVVYVMYSWFNSRDGLLGERSAVRGRKQTSFTRAVLTGYNIAELRETILYDTALAQRGVM